MMSVGCQSRGDVPIGALSVRSNSCVKPCARRGKTGRGRADAAIRLAMRFVPVMDESTQARPMTRKARAFPAPGLPRSPRQSARVSANSASWRRRASGMPGACPRRPSAPACRLLPGCWPGRSLPPDQSDALAKESRRATEASAAAERPQAIPGIGPVTATALADAAGCRASRDLSAWPGRTPEPHSSGGREKPGRMSIAHGTVRAARSCRAADVRIAGGRRREDGCRT
ncbi:transposase [Poseidonocella sp. HB161398]|uniref:transposase n=1 Tax=Poseidonocella sp. HB161398 TaxID=2320855 RepID=UPI0011096934